VCNETKSTYICSENPTTTTKENRKCKIAIIDNNKVTAS
jgi:hypothetical protein